MRVSSIDFSPGTDVTSIDRAAHRPLGTARARFGQVAAAVAIDMSVAVALTALTFAASAVGAADHAILTGLTLVGFLVAQGRSWARTGRTLGSTITGVRRVVAFDGAPPGFDRAFGATWLADIRRARDPVAPEPMPAPAPGHDRVNTPTTPESPRSMSRALLVIDGRSGGAIGYGVVLGRNPTATGSERAVSVADIGREISKVHLALRVDDGGRVWVVDRQSTNGSLITRRDGVTRQLAPGKPVELAAGDVVQIGNHTVAVQFVTEVRVAAR